MKHLIQHALMISLLAHCFAPMAEGETFLPTTYFGPGDQHSLSTFHLATMPQSGSLAASRITLDNLEQTKTNIRFGILTAWSSEINYNKNLFDIDLETLQNTMYVSWAPARNWLIDFAAPFLTRSSGYMDDPIREWHRFFGLPQGARNILEDNRYSFNIQTRQGRPFQGPKQGTGIGVSRIALRHSLWNNSNEGTSPTISGTGKEPAAELTLLTALGLPASSEDYGQQSVDLQAGLIGNYQPELFAIKFGYIDIGIFATRYFDTTIAGDHSGQLQFFSEHYSSYTYITSPEIVNEATIPTRLFLGTLINSAQVSNVPTFDIATAYFDFGARLKIGPTQLSISCRENTPHSARTTDISFIFNLEYTGQ